jgi:hypothetical protein
MPMMPRADSRFRFLHVEALEPRQLLSSTPWGAGSLDTAEYLLGDVGVTLVLMESQGSVSSEDWTTESIDAVKTKVAEGLQWWKDTLATQSSVHSLNFVFDTSYADNPVPTTVEPIARTSNTYVTWVNEFLTYVQANSSETISTDIRNFNDSQRQALSTHWAFTIFVVNDENDADGQFAAGGSFSRAFAFPGGQFYVAPAGRPAATFAHELGHIFWARDEYSGAGSYADQRGYYDAQNWNAANNPTAGFEQVDSIMASGTLMANAYAQHVSSLSSLEMIGWRDTDQDGVFDVLDVPHQLQGTGAFDLVTGKYRFVGSASVQSLPNLNSSGQHNDIVLSQVDVVEYRLDGGAWQTLETPGSYQAELNLSIPAGPAVQVVEVRTRSEDVGTGQTVANSDIFWGRTDVITTTAEAGIRGVVWNDANGDGVWAAGEDALAGWQVQLVDGAGQPVELASYVEPDDFGDSESLNTQNPDVTLAPIGSDVGNVPVFSRQSQYTSSGSRVFANDSWSQGAVTTGWADSKRELRMSFTEPVTYVSIDAVADTNGDYGRLEIYDASDQLLARYTTAALNQGQVESMVLATPTAEISYAIASGHGGTDVQLDQLQVGPNSVVTTDAQGAYWLSWLPPAEYRLQTVAQSNWSATAPSGGIHIVVLTAGQASGQIDFGQQAAPGSPWQNQTTPNDVNKDLVLTPLDALIVINDLNVNGARQLPNPPAEGEGPPPFPDVNGDGYLTPSDALGVINALNLICCSGEGAGEGESEGADQGSQAGSSAEGEAAWLWAQPGHGPWNQPPTSSRPVATKVGDPLANAEHDVALVAASFELAVHQQAAKVSHKPSSGQLADQKSAMDPLLESVGPDSALEAVFFGLGLGCTL